MAVGAAAAGGGEEMKTKMNTRNFSEWFGGAARGGAFAVISFALASSATQAPAAQAPSSPSKKSSSSSSSSSQKVFSSPNAAADALISAAARYDVPELTEILGADGIDLVVSEDKVQDKNTAGAFARKGLAKRSVAADPKNAGRMILYVGDDDYPTAIPIVRAQKGWRFDSKAGRQELLYRRIGGNELDAIQICNGIVEKQHEYASKKHSGAQMNK